MREILMDIERWRQEGKTVAIATVVKVYGSGPRRYVLPRRREVRRNRV